MGWKCQEITENSQSTCGHINRDHDRICLNCGVMKNNFTVVSIHQESNTVNVNQASSKDDSDDRKSNNSPLPKNLNSKSNRQTFLMTIIVLIITLATIVGVINRQTIAKVIQEQLVEKVFPRQRRSQSEKPENIIDKTQWENYQNTENSFVLKYDRNWKKDETKKIITGEIVSFYPRKISPNNEDLTTIENIKFTITIDAINDKMSLDEYGEYLLEQMDEKSRHNAIVSENILNNQKAKQISFETIDENGQNIKNRSIWVLDNYNAYRIDYIAEESEFAKYQPIVEEMINSFQINNNLNTSN